MNFNTSTPKCASFFLTVQVLSLQTSGWMSYPDLGLNLYINHDFFQLRMSILNETWSRPNNGDLISSFLVDIDFLMHAHNWYLKRVQP